jgi:YVTN family beta-propeller protein
MLHSRIMSSPSRSTLPPGRRVRRARRARTYRRRRIVALAAVIVLVAVLGGALWAAFGGCGGDPRDVAASSGSDRAPDDPSGKPSPSPGATAWAGPPSSSLKLKLRGTIVDSDISPKSVVSTGTGYVFAQNMMYKHTMTVYDAETLKLVETIPDAIDAAAFRIKGHGETIQGAPVEAAAMPDGRFMYVSQYSMYGDGFTEGRDVCAPGDGTDKSYVYRVPLDTLEIDKVIKVGAVPKYVAVTPDQRYLLVSNWCTYSLSVVDIHTSRQIEDVYLGPYPRGIAVSPDSKAAYVAVMGSSDVAVVDLEDFSLSWIRGVGSGPRHLCMAPNGKYLYATLNAEGTVAKIDTKTREVVDKVGTGAQPRSMAIAPDGKSLFVVNYESSTMSMIRTSDLTVMDTVNTNALPIGITYDAPTKSVWVCCYTGSIMVFKQV